MDETRDTDQAIDAPEGVTLLAIPEEHITQVREHLASLQQQEAEVAGYAMGIPTVKGIQGTGMTLTGPPAKPSDVFFLDGI